MGKNAKNEHKKALELHFSILKLMDAPKSKFTLMKGPIFEISKM